MEPWTLRNNETFKREENKIKGPGDKKGDAGTVIQTTEAGGTIGTVAGLATKNVGAGAGVGLLAEPPRESSGFC